jgi:hypothetical protein
MRTSDHRCRSPARDAQDAPVMRPPPLRATLHSPSTRLPEMRGQVAHCALRGCTRRGTRQSCVIIPCHDSPEMEASAHVAAGSTLTGEIHETVMLRMTAGARPRPEPAVRGVRKRLHVQGLADAGGPDEGTQLVKLRYAPGTVPGRQRIGSRRRLGPGQAPGLTLTPPVHRTLTHAAAHPDQSLITIGHEVGARNAETLTGGERQQAGGEQDERRRRQHGSHLRARTGHGSVTGMHGGTAGTGSHPGRRPDARGQGRGSRTPRALAWSARWNLCTAACPSCPIGGRCAASSCGVFQLRHQHLGG